MPHRISEILDGTGLLEGGRCLRCEVCCRFPEATSPMTPWFSCAEIEAALRANGQCVPFPPGRYGPGAPALLVPMGDIFRCPYFIAASNCCSIYEARPLDCRLYPFVLMYDHDGKNVLLGLDEFCPAVEQADPARLEAHAEEMAALLEGALREAICQRRGIVGAYKSHVRPMRTLASLSRALCRTDLGLARLVPTARSVLEPFFAAQASGRSTHALAPLYVWSDMFDMYYKVVGQRALILAAGDGDAFLICPPIGTGDLLPAAQEGMELLRALDPRAPSPRIQEADDLCAGTLATAGWSVRETHTEYVYRRRELAELRGNRFEKKRQLCNRFEREHAWLWRAFEPDDLTEAASLHLRWISQRVRAHPDEFYAAQAEASFWAAQRGLREAEALGITARVLEAEGKMAGFTAGCALHDEATFHILFEISDVAIRGAAQVMFREFCRELEGYSLINAGGASGLENLARVKESYRPTLRLACHTLVPTSGRVPRCD